MVSKNSLSVNCLLQSVIRGLFVGFYGGVLSLVMPDEDKHLQVEWKIGCVNKSTVVFQIAPSVPLFPQQFLSVLLSVSKGKQLLTSKSKKKVCLQQ